MGATSLKQERLSGDREESPGFSRGEDVNMQILEDENQNWIKRLGMLKAALEVSMADIGSGHHRHHDHDVED
jgi:hypothetical protein